jgi:hypothetical protein
MATGMPGMAICAALPESDKAPLYLFTATPNPYDVLVLADRPDLASIGGWIQRGAGSAVMVATTVILVGRLRRADPAHRLVMVPLHSYGILLRGRPGRRRPRCGPGSTPPLQSCANSSMR